MTAENIGKALYCENCTYIRDGAILHQVLGSITPEGYLIVKRAHNLNTILHLTQFTISCTCGYNVSIRLGNPSLKQTDLYEQTN